MANIFAYLQEKSKEKKVIPGRKEEETKRKKLTVVDSQVTFINKLLYKCCKC